MMAGHAAATGGGGGLSVSLDTYVVDVDRTGVGTIVPVAVTATPAGGTGPYTYLWTGSYNTVAVTFLSDAVSASASFSAYLEYEGQVATGTFWCRVTDALGATVLSAGVAVTITCLPEPEE